MSLPPPPLALAWFAKTQPKRLWLDAIVAKYGQQCRDAALDAAFKKCRLLATCEENSDNYRDGAAWCAEQIRSLK